MRTDEQKQAFVMECLEIEKAGGDVLGYIEVNWPSYTPRATWYNLQKRYLNRNTAHLTEGRPEVPKGDEKEMQRRNRMKILDGVIAAIEKGNHPYDYLEEQGYMVPMQAYADLKKWAKANAPEKAEILPVNLKGLKLNRQKIPRVKDKPAPELKAGEPLPVKLPDGGKIEAGKPSPFPDPDYSNEMIIPRNTGDHVSAEDFRKTVEFNGKEYERMNKPSPTCCQQARLSGVTVPDELPICALKSRVWGEWHLSSVAGGIHLVWDDPISHEARCISMTAADWKRLAEEIPMAIRQLGL